MRSIAAWVKGALAVITIAGCVSAPTGSGMPCESCKYGVRSVGKAAPARVFCVVDGKEVDCHKSPEECPECKKMHGSN